MKLKEFNKVNAGSGKISTALVTVGVKGLVSINQAGCEKMKLKAGDRVSLFQDEEREKDWYLCRTDSENGFQLRENKSGSRSFNSSKLAASIVDSLGLEEAKSFKCLIGGMSPFEGKELFALITKSIK